MVLDLPAGRIARRELITVDEGNTVLEAAKEMVAKSRGSILATRSGDPVGILTERDILKKVVATDLDPSSTRVKDVMTSPLVTIDYNKPLREAIDLMVRKGL